MATHVYRHNHDREYNPFLSACDDIEHVLFPTFEDFSENFNAFMEEHGRKLQVKYRALPLPLRSLLFSCPPRSFHSY